MFFSRPFLVALGIALAATAAQAQSTTPPPALPSAPSAPATVAPAAQAAPAPQPVPTASESRYPPSSLSLTLGWGAPYGWGIDYSRLVSRNVDLNVGVGIGVGAKIGVGARYYFAPQRKVSPYAGANLVRTGGIADFQLTVNAGAPGEETTLFSINPSSQLHLRGGIRWQPAFRFALLGTLGYGVTLGGDPVVYAPGYAPQYQSTRDVVSAISPGGVEFSIGFAIGLGRPDYPTR